MWKAKILAAGLMCRKRASQDWACGWMERVMGREEKRARLVGAVVAMLVVLSFARAPDMKGPPDGLREGG